MCGRYVCPEEAEIERAWAIGRRDHPPFQRRYNTTPDTQVPVLRGAADRTLVLNAARWGFVPHWWKDERPPRNTINARVETAVDKPMWRSAFQQARCVLPAVGWYEWAPPTGLSTDGQPPPKRPWFFSARDGALLAFAGLWSLRRGADGEAVLTVAILTRPAEGPSAAIHARMPVVLPAALQAPWLDPSVRDARALAATVAVQSTTDVAQHAVRRLVNHPRNEGPELIEPLPESGDPAA
ncbi:MAG: SOS response-associated peptidase [Algiphilus sp.]